ncbi:MAG: alanine racemase [Actinomycetota bacterium]|nr:alanine racemase [Actinomycetota bacterium]
MAASGTGHDRAFRPVWAEVDLDAVRANVRTLADFAAPAALMAVVKADGYGHGAVPVARAALDAGASWLGVALVEEGAELRAAGIDAPILVLSEPPPAAAPAVVGLGLTPVAYTPVGIEALAKAVAHADTADPLPVHLKIDTGMHRVGCMADDALALGKSIAGRDELRLEGVLTHFAVADEPDNPYTAQQLDRFDRVLGDLRDAGVAFDMVHAANSAALLAFGDRARLDLVRCGIAVYGVPPAPALAGRVPLRPAMALKARVSHVKTLAAGARLSYGLRYTMPHDGSVATVPAGYADGVPRALSVTGGEVVVRGRRHPIAGTVTMDQFMVDVGDAPVEVGDEVVLLGRDGDAEVTADEWADRLGTINYEIVCGIGRRVPRTYRA